MEKINKTFISVLSLLIIGSLAVSVFANGWTRSETLFFTGELDTPLEHPIQLDVLTDDYTGELQRETWYDIYLEVSNIDLYSYENLAFMIYTTCENYTTGENNPLATDMIDIYCTWDNLTPEIDFDGYMPKQLSHGTIIISSIDFDAEIAYTQNVLFRIRLHNSAISGIWDVHMEVWESATAGD